MHLALPYATYDIDRRFLAALHAKLGPVRSVAWLVTSGKVKPDVPRVGGGLFDILALSVTCARAADVHGCCRCAQRSHTSQSRLSISQIHISKIHIEAHLPRDMAELGGKRRSDRLVERALLRCHRLIQLL